MMFLTPLTICSSVMFLQMFSLLLHVAYVSTLVSAQLKMGWPSSHFLVAQQLYIPVHMFFLFLCVHKSHGQTHK